MVKERELWESKIWKVKIKEVLVDLVFIVIKDFLKS